MDCLADEIRGAAIGRQAQLAYQAVQEGGEEAVLVQVVPLRIEGKGRDRDASTVLPGRGQGQLPVAKADQGLEVGSRCNGETGEEAG